MPLHLLKFLPPASSVASFVAGQVKGPATRALKLDPLSRGFRESLKAFLSAFEREFEQEETLYSYLRESTEESMSAFLDEESTRQALLEAFTSPETFDIASLPTLWKELRKADGSGLVALPPSFDWGRVGSAYLNSVRDIQNNDPELRETWKARTLANIDRNIEALRETVPAFDLDAYCQTINEEFGTIKLTALPAQYDSGAMGPRISLQRVFVPQLLKESLYGSHTEGNEAFTGDHSGKYQPPREHIYELSEVIQSDDGRIVICGGAGLGKSTLLSHIALEWVEKRLGPVPFVIELRKYVKDHSQPSSFETFLESGTWSYFHISRRQLNEVVTTRDSIFLFDGLDEVFDEALRSNIVNEIAAFSRDHPRARIVVTSRSAGYFARAAEETLRSAAFRHFTLQEFNDSQINQFVTKWFAQQQCDGAEREELTSRLVTAIQHSKPLRELAGNPLLLTMMSLVNRRKPLPQERTRLYEECSEVLIETWDTARFLEPSVHLAYDDKLEILQSVAREMQSGATSSTPTISWARLHSILVTDLGRRGIPKPAYAARKVIASLVERDSMLCRSANEEFAFVHRTFCDYFCAKELVSHLADGGGENELLEIAKSKWRDESWHEILRLVCGMVGPNLASKLIHAIFEAPKEEHSRVFLAAECAAEVRFRGQIERVREMLFGALVELIDHAPHDQGMDAAAMAVRTGAVDRLARFWRDPNTKTLLMKTALTKNYWAVRFRSVEGVISQWKDETTRLWLIEHTTDTDWLGAQSAIHGLAFGWPDENSYGLICDLLETRNGDPIITTIIETLVAYWPNVVNRQWLMDLVKKDGRHEVLWHAMSEVVDHWKDVVTKRWLIDIAMQDSRQEARSTAVGHLARGWPDESVRLLSEWAHQSEDSGLRQAALLSMPLLEMTPETRSLLMKRLDDEANDKFRSELIQTLAFYWRDEQMRTLLLQWAESQEQWESRLTSLMVLARFWKRESGVQRLLAERASTDPEAKNRLRLLRYVVWLLPKSQVTLELVETMLKDEDASVRDAAALAQKEMSELAED